VSERQHVDGGDERGASASSHKKSGGSTGNGTGSKTAIVAVGKGEVALTRDDAIGATINTKWLKVAATGQWAAAIVIGAALLRISDSLAEHATFAVFLALFGGFVAGRAASNGRVLDAIRDRERAYLEVERMADVKKVLENELLKARVSSKVEEAKRKSLEATKSSKKGKGDGK
jgi:hypothetical protein